MSSKGSNYRHPLSKARQSQPVPQVTIHRAQGSITLTFADESFPEPAEGFIADFTDVKSSNEGIKLLFAKSHPLTSQAVALVEVIIRWEAFRDTVWKALMSGNFVAGLRKHCDTDDPSWQQDVVHGLQEADYHTRLANAVVSGYARGEAVLDFYTVSPLDVAHLIRGRDRNVNVEPVLRVHLAMHQLRRCLDLCEQALRERG